MNPKKAPCFRACRITRFVGLAVACCLALTPASGITQADSTADSGTVFTDEIGGVLETTLLGNGGALSGSAVVLPGNTTGNQTASMRKLKINRQPTCAHRGHLTTNPS